MAEESKNVSRREFLKIAGITGATIGLAGGLGGVVAACGEEETTTTTGAPATTATTAPSTTASTEGSTTSVSAGPEAGREIKIGYVAPLTGMLAVFGIADQYCVDRANEGFAQGVLAGDGKLHPVTVIMQDGQSTSTARLRSPVTSSTTRRWTCSWPPPPAPTSARWPTRQRPQGFPASAPTAPGRTTCSPARPI